MVFDIASYLEPPPISITDCLVNGEIDIHRYWMYQRGKRRKDIQSNILNSIIRKHQNKRKRGNEEVFISPRKRVRSVKRHKLFYRDSDGHLKEFKSCNTLWWLLYVNQAPRNDRQRKIFRSRFRLPHADYLELANDCANDPLFKQWLSKDCTKEKSNDIKLLLLGTLRYLGRGWTFDDMEEATCISRESHRQFFNVFIEYGSTVLYDRHVTSPATNTDVSVFEELFNIAGYNGCIGSSDATHVGMLSCPVWSRINHLGHKLNIPSRTYNATVTHCRQILGTTSGHPATWNDKTIILYDEFVRGIHEGVLFEDNEFTLFEYDALGNIVEVKYQGVWIMVDNGYLDWSTTMPPMKHGVTYKCIRFSEWLESMRKDVECTFGIMKGRFCILRYGIRLRSISKCDAVWKTCCALHNRLLFVDGLHKDWATGERSDWEVTNAKHEAKTVGKFAINRLNKMPSVPCNNLPTEGGKANLDQYVVNGRRVVRKIPFDIFQRCLIEHFDIRFQKNTVKWPSRCKTKQIL